MVFYEILSLFPITSKDNVVYNSIAFNGEYFYLLNSKQNIVYQYSSNFQFIAYHNTSRTYNCICYNSIERCFLAYSNKTSNIIYKLNENFQEFDLITINECIITKKRVTSISYDYRRNTILLNTCNSIIEITNGNDNKAIVRQQKNQNNYLASEAFGMYYLNASTKNDTQCISVFSYDNSLIFEFSLPIRYHVSDITFLFCKSSPCDCYHFYIMANENNSHTYMIQLILNVCDTFPSPQNEWSYNTQFCCGNECDDILNHLNECNYCETECNECRQPVNNVSPFRYLNYCKNHCNHSNGCAHTSDVVESIALVQTSLSKIITTESEKINRTVNCSNNIADFLDVNCSVHKTLNMIIQLEQILCSQLNSVLDNPHCNTVNISNNNT